MLNRLIATLAVARVLRQGYGFVSCAVSHSNDVAAQANEFIVSATVLVKVYQTVNPMNIGQVGALLREAARRVLMVQYGLLAQPDRSICVSTTPALFVPECLEGRPQVSVSQCRCRSSFEIAHFTKAYNSTQRGFPALCALIGGCKAKAIGVARNSVAPLSAIRATLLCPALFKRLFAIGAPPLLYTFLSSRAVVSSSGLVYPVGARATKPLDAIFTSRLTAIRAQPSNHIPFFMTTTILSLALACFKCSGGRHIVSSLGSLINTHYILPLTPVSSKTSVMGRLVGAGGI